MNTRQRENAGPERNEIECHIGPYSTSAADIGRAGVPWTRRPTPGALSTGPDAQEAHHEEAADAEDDDIGDDVHGRATPARRRRPATA